MRWKAVWLTTMLVVTTSTVQNPMVNTIDHNPIEVLEAKNSSEDLSDPIIKNPLSLEAVVILSTTDAASTLSISSTTLTMESRENPTRGSPQDEITLIENSEDEPGMVESPEDTGSSIVVNTPDEININEDHNVELKSSFECIEDEDDCVNQGTGDGDNGDNDDGDNDEGDNDEGDNDEGDNDEGANDEGDNNEGDNNEGDNDEGDNDEGDNDEGDNDEGDIDDGDYDEGDNDEGDNDEGDNDEGDNDEGDNNEGDNDEGDNDEGDNDEGDNDEGDNDEGDNDEGDNNEGDNDEGDNDEGDNNEGENSSNDEDESNEILIVETKSGRVQGFTWQGKDDIISYIDIPYGTITHQFQAATTPKPWDTMHSVKDHNKRCPQLQENLYVGDIHCLTLSIFKPLDAKNASVLFHIHADDFETGSGNPFIYGPEYLVSNGIILVLPNYRLGALGFLCMQNETAPGNMALKDLTLALGWISENIEAFGGDPKNIAVSGDGKSGALAGLLALSPRSKDYVSKVIAESGSFLSYWALDRDPLSTAKDLFESISVVGKTQSRVDISLQDLNPSVIVTAAKGLRFRPCLETNNDTAFIVQTPYEIITNEKFENISFLIGSAMYAGVHEALIQTEESIRKLNEDFTLFLPEDLKFETVALKTEAGERVKTQYFGTEAISVGNVKNLSLCFTDMGYLGPGIRSARLLVESGANVYFYEFAFVGEMNIVLESINHTVEGAVRGDIVGYLFTQDGMVPGEQQTEERKMVDTLTQIWTNFLNTGVPSTDSIEWKKLEIQDHLDEEWLLIDSDLQVKQGLHVDRLTLWTEIYEKHYIDASHGHQLSSSVYTILMLQIIFWLVFWKNVSRIY